MVRKYRLWQATKILQCPRNSDIVHTDDLYSIHQNNNIKEEEEKLFISYLNFFSNSRTRRAWILWKSFN